VIGRSTAGRPATLAEHVAARGTSAPRLAPDLVAVLEALAGAGARLAGAIARAPLTNTLGETGAINPHGDRVRRLDIVANDLLLAALQRTGVVSVVASEELSTPVVWPRAGGAPGFAVCVDPLDGSLNSDVAGVMGTIFGIWPGPAPGAADPARAVLGAGTRQVAAGYLVYGASTVFVYAAGSGVHVFVHDPTDGQFRLAHAAVRIPDAGRTYAVNDANWPRWGPAPRALVEELRRAAAGDGRYALRYSGALAADFHRTLLEGGLYLYPEDAARPGGRIRLLYEAAPLALVAEAAGGRASTGHGRILDVIAEDHHQRTPVYIGSRAEVGWAERCHRESPG
jgi:fructose-1,6-bisphosphatase I